MGEFFFCVCVRVFDFTIIPSNTNTKEQNNKKEGWDKEGSNSPTNERYRKGRRDERREEGGKKCRKECAVGYYEGARYERRTKFTNVYERNEKYR